MKCNKGIRINIVLSALIVISMSSCLKITNEDLEMKEDMKIQKFLEDNSSLAFITKESGLYYLDVKTGTGSAVTSHDTAYIFYTAKLLDETVLETNTGTTDTLIFPVGENYLIKGLDEGVTYMKEGGKALFIVPSRLAYGSTGNYYTIGGYTPLLFNVDLVRVKKGPGKK
jgi:FKBP-type peptidyl-prolyl cis-trans isomerase FkpA